MAPVVGFDAHCDFGPALIVVSKESSLDTNEEMIIGPLSADIPQCLPTGQAISGQFGKPL